MSQRARLSKFALNSSGFSLTELVVVVALLLVVAAGTTAQLLNSYKDGVKLQSKANMTQTMGLVHKAFGKTSIHQARTCAQTLQLAEAFQPSGETDVRLSVGASEVYQEGSKVPGSAAFQINRLYLTDNFPLVQRPNSYVTTLYLVANVGTAQAMNQMKPRAVATLVVTLNTAGGIESCNVSIEAPDERETCDAMYGMNWNEQTQQCDQALAMDADFNLTSCPAGTRLVGQVCVPTPTGCAHGQLARGFDRGLVQSCEEPPLNPAVGIPTQSVPPPVAGVPNQTPQPVQDPGSRIPAVTTGGIPPTTPSTNPPLSCGDMIGAANYEYCYNNEACRPYLTEPADTSCVERTAIPYSTPEPQSTPSPEPPNDETCACNDARIPNGSYCMYCIPRADYGYGFVDYAYGVSICTNGNLVPDPSAPVQMPPPQCSGGYAPVQQIQTPYGPRFRQIPGYDTNDIQ